jgi:arylsulfatase A-like enzyme
LEDRLNVALIVLDAVRADHVSCYGYGRPTTPHLDQFAEGATRYARVVAPGVWTFPSMASMFTGTYPSQHRLNRANRQVPQELSLLAERLHDQGWQTGGFSANPYVGRTYGFDRGYDQFREYWGPSAGGSNSRLGGVVNGAYQWLWPRVKGTLKRSQTLTRAYQHYLHRKVEGGGKGAAALVTDAIEWVQQARGDDRGRPWFLYAHLMEAHGPLAPPAEHATRFLDAESYRQARMLNQDAMAYMAGANPLTPQEMQLLVGLYDASISYVDEQLGRLLDALGGDEDTVVMITADHGNSFGEHGILDHFFSVHQSLAAVPLVIRHHQIPVGVVERPVGTIDLTPTILETAGLETIGLSGISLSSGTDARDCLVTEFLDPPVERFNRFHRFNPVRYRRELRGMQRGRDKYIWSSDGHDELYNLATDPLETTNLASTEPVLLAELRSLHDVWLQQLTAEPATVAARTSPSDFQVEDDVAATLRTLGYLD